MEESDVLTVNLKAIQTQITKSIIQTVVGTSLGIIVICVAFYYNTQNTLSNHHTDIQELKTNQGQQQNHLNNMETNVAIDNTMINTIDKRISSVEQKVDAVYDLLVKMNKNN